MRPTASCSRRRIRTHAAWKVETHIERASPPTRASTRPRISPAALFVKVIARTSWGSCAAAREQVGNAVSQDPGLTRSSPGDDEERGAFVGDGLGLLGD